MNPNWFNPNQQKMTRRKTIWLIAAILTFIIFYFLIPPGIANISPLFISVLGAFLLVFFTTQAFGDFRSIREYSQPRKEEIDWRHKRLPFLVLPGLVMTFVFFMNFHSDEKNELKTNGERVVGKITDGSSLKTGRGGAFNLTVEFTTKTGENVTASESVGEADFRSVHKGDLVDLIYSKKDPKIIVLLLNDVVRKDYDFSGTEKDIKVEDLFKLMTLQQEDLGSALNKMNYLWTYNPADSMWENNAKDLYIKSNSKDKIVLNSFDIAEETLSEDPAFFPDKYGKQFLTLNFKLTQNDSIKFYNNEKYAATIKESLKRMDVGFKVGQKIEIQKK